MTWDEIVLTSRHQRVLGITLLRTKALRCFCPSSSCFPKAAHTCYVLLHVGYVSCYVAATFPRVNEHTPAHRRSAWATRGLACHTELPKTLRTIPTYVVYDMSRNASATNPVRGNEIFGKTERPAPLVTHGTARHFPAPLAAGRKLKL